MVYNTKFSPWASVKEKNYETPYEAKDSFRQWSKEKEKLASQAIIFGGRRLLGLTNKDNPIWLSFTIDKETLDISMKLSHDIDTRRTSKLCPRSIRLATGEQLSNLDNAMRPAGRTEHGEVTQRTLNYIDKVMTICNSRTLGRVKGKCSKSLFMIVSNLVYHGSPDEGKFRWRDVMSTWNMPDGEYMTVY